MFCYFFNIFIVGNKIADKFDDLTHPGETRTQKMIRKTKNYVEDVKEDIKEKYEDVKDKILNK